MILRSIDACYCKGTEVLDDGSVGCKTYSAFQRGEIVEMTTDVTDTIVKVIGHWKDYTKARAEVKAFNRKQHESISSR
jgi:hypothetical protein